MIRRVMMLAAAAAALAFAPAARAAEAAKGPQIGIGVSIDPTRINNPPISLYVPIDIGRLRIEPYLGFSTFSQNATYADFAGDISSQYWWEVGAGVVYFLTPAQPFGFYAGGRLALQFSGYEYPITNPGPGGLLKSSETDVALMGVLGGEYFVAPRFSVGAEARLGVTFLGDPNLTFAAPVLVPSRGAVAWHTNGVVFLRYFF